MSEEPFVRTSRSNAPIRCIALVSAIVDFVRWGAIGYPSKTRNELRLEIMRIVNAVWPKASAYTGHTHFRILLDGATEFDSVYVDWETEQPGHTFESVGVSAFKEASE